MKKTKLLIALASLAAGLVLAGCKGFDEALDSSVNDVHMLPLVGRSYEAQWQVDREVIDTATLSILDEGSIQVSRVPTLWLQENFMPDVDRNGIFQSSEPLWLIFQVVGYSGIYSYVSTASATSTDAEPSEYGFTLTSARQLFAVESNALNDSCSVTAYWSPMQSAGVYDSQRDAWTIAFSVDSVVVERAVVVANGPSGGADRQSFCEVERFSPALKLNLVTTKRKE